MRMMWVLFGWSHAVCIFWPSCLFHYLSTAQQPLSPQQQQPSGGIVREHAEEACLTRAWEQLWRRGGRRGGSRRSQEALGSCKSDKDEKVDKDAKVHEDDIEELADALEDVTVSTATGDMKVICPVIQYATQYQCWFPCSVWNNCESDQTQGAVQWHVLGAALDGTWSFLLWEAPHSCNQGELKEETSKEVIL